MSDDTSQSTYSRLQEILDSIEGAAGESWDLSRFLSSDDEELSDWLEDMMKAGITSGDAELELLLNLIESDDDRYLDSLLILRTESGAKFPAGLAGRELNLLGTLPGVDQGELAVLLFGKDYRLLIHASSPGDVPWTPLAAVAFVQRFEPLTSALLELESHLEVAWDILAYAEWLAILKSLRQGQRIRGLLERAKQSLRDQGFDLTSEHKLIVRTGKRGQPPIFLRQLTARLFDYLTLKTGITGNTELIQRAIRALLIPYVKFDIEDIRSAISDHLRSG